MDYTNAIPSANGRPAAGKLPDPFAGAGEGIAAFDTTAAAPDYTPIPPGIYVARVIKGECITTKTTGAEAYRLRFEVTEGKHVGKTVMRTWTFGAKALPYTKRDLEEFGLTTTAALLSPFPPVGREFHVRLAVAVQHGDDGRDWNDIKHIEVLDVDESPAAAYMLPGQGKGDASEGRVGERGDGGHAPLSAAPRLAEEGCGRTPPRFSGDNDRQGDASPGQQRLPAARQDGVTVPALTARALASSLEPFSPTVVGGELAFGRALPPDLETQVALLRTGVRALLSRRTWMGRGDELATAAVVELDLDRPIPAGVTRLRVVGDQSWDRFDPAARTDLPQAFAPGAVQRGDESPAAAFMLAGPGEGGKPA